jgi:serine/threonine protein kinase
MADVMLQIQDAGCLFPDAKITNWLINSDGKLIISDTKSFLFTDENQNFVPGIPGNEYCTLLNSANFTPPEFNARPVSINADSIHAYLLGKNIHRFITGSIQYDHDGSKFDFNYPFFKEGEGLEIRTLIEALVKPDPAERMPVKEALTQFFLINNQEVKSLAKELNELKCGPKDKKMDEFIHEKVEEIRNATPQKREELISELKEIIKDLKADATVSEANQIVTNFRKGHDEFAMGINTRADKIEQEMIHIPIQERRTLHQSETSSIVKQAIQSHHHLSKPATSDAPQANTTQVAATFKNFKERFAQQIHGNEDKVENEAEASHSLKVH